ncbi:hypothetical protein HMN09_00239100 [Mycena chlorophos]|uniref:Uncharacterized protein n=1 Tax=Mycena chlorophos TaxID=658473 RepID=A0A8H6WNR9_MYCCL|nr:hypothetical protein HMN09_00239100 [Mycena chlorophos]
MPRNFFVRRTPIDGFKRHNLRSHGARRPPRVFDDNQTLVHTVEKENYAGAERIYRRLVSECIPIRKHPAYERAALEQIRRLDKQDLRGFRLWLKLVPDNPNPHRVEGGPLTKTRNHLFRSGNPAGQLKLLSQFALIAARKGYSKLVWADAVALMVQFQERTKAVAFFRALEAARHRYFKTYFPVSAQNVASNQRKTLIHIFCAAGWLDDAVELVRDSQTLQIGAAALKLVDLLRARGRTEQAEAVLSYLPAKMPQAVSAKAVIEGRASVPARATIALQLRQLKNLISKRALVPNRSPASHLHSFMAHYRATTNSSPGFWILRRRALAERDGCSYHWLVKELFYLRLCHRHSDVVSVFCANFWKGFLPEREGAMLRELAAREAEPKLLSACAPKKLNIKPTDAWLVWNSMVRLVVGLPRPERLPTLELLRYSVAQYISQVPDTTFNPTPAAYPTVFRSIIWAYGELGDLDGAVSTTRDLELIGKSHHVMEALRLQDELAAVYARHGHVDSVNKLLDALDAHSPRLQTYGLVIDAYLQASRPDLAAEIVTRMKIRCRFISGDNWRLDRSLAAVEAAFPHREPMDELQDEYMRYRAVV